MNPDLSSSLHILPGKGRGSFAFLLCPLVFPVPWKAKSEVQRGIGPYQRSHSNSAAGIPRPEPWNWWEVAGGYWWGGTSGAPFPPLPPPRSHLAEAVALYGLVDERLHVLVSASNHLLGRLELRIRLGRLEAAILQVKGEAGFPAEKTLPQVLPQQALCSGVRTQGWPFFNARWASGYVAVTWHSLGAGRVKAEPPAPKPYPAKP